MVFVRFVRSDFPDAYAGTNTQLRDVINNLVEKEPQNWHTVSVALNVLPTRCLQCFGAI